MQSRYNVYIYIYNRVCLVYVFSFICNGFCRYKKKWCTIKMQRICHVSLLFFLYVASCITYTMSNVYLLFFFLSFSSSTTPIHLGEQWHTWDPMLLSGELSIHRLHRIKSIWEKFSIVRTQIEFHFN